MAATLILC